MPRTVTLALPPLDRLARGLAVFGAALVLLAAGVVVGRALVSAGPAAEFASGELQEVQTVGGTYVGQVVEDRDYLRLRGPAIVRAESGQTGRFIVQLLATDPYDVSGDVIIPRAQVVLVGNVAAGSGLETAYRQATGELPTPTPVPSP